MENENYAQLLNIVKENISTTIQMHEFNFVNLFHQMEEEFTRLGFRENPTKECVENILILRLDAMGDFILTTPAIRTIRENYPHAHITLAVSNRIYPLAECCPYVNEVLNFNTNFDKTNILEVMVQDINFAANNFWKRRYHLSFDFVSDFMHMFMSYFSGARERFGYNFGQGNILSARKLFFNRSTLLDHSKFIHQCERNLYLLQHFGLKLHRTNLEIWFEDIDLYRARKILQGFGDGRLKIVAGIGASNTERKYPIEKYLVVFKELIARGVAIVILGGPTEAEDAKFLEDNLPKESVKNIVEMKPDWRTSAAVISLMDMYVGNDTGTLHVAAAMQKMVIALSPDSKDHTRTVGVNCTHIGFHPWQTYSIVLLPEHSLGDCAKDLTKSCRAGKAHCITQIEPNEVISAFDEMMHFIKYSRITKISQPPILKITD